ncbi:hypothetical protein STANM309S_03148 [Streptomyces tanashiensis]
MRFSSYGIERGSPYEPGYRSLVEDIVKAADPRVDFSAYDLVNILVTPNAGPSALDTVLSVTFSGNEDAPYADGVPLANTSFVYSRQDDGSGSFTETGYRVLPHENGHVFGLPDLYTSDGGGTVGHWDIMSEDWGANNDLLAWHKWKLGWLDNDQVSCAAGPGTGDYSRASARDPRRPQARLRPALRHLRIRRRGPQQGRQRRGRLRAGRPRRPRGVRRGHRPRPGDRGRQRPGQLAAAPDGPTSTRSCRTPRTAPARPSPTAPTASGSPSSTRTRRGRTGSGSPGADPGAEPASAPASPSAPSSP